MWAWVSATPPQGARENSGRELPASPAKRARTLGRGFFSSHTGRGRVSCGCGPVLGQLFTRPALGPGTTDPGGCPGRDRQLPHRSCAVGASDTRHVPRGVKVVVGSESEYETRGLPEATGQAGRGWGAPGPPGMVTPTCSQVPLQPIAGGRVPCQAHLTRGPAVRLSLPCLPLWSPHQANRRSPSLGLQHGRGSAENGLHEGTPPAGPH